MDTLSPLERSERMRSVKPYDTKPELELRRLIWGLGYRYRKNRNDIIGKPDIAFIGKKRAIFLHGCFWHRHNCHSGQRMPKSKIDFWSKKFEKTIKRDKFVKHKLHKQGWRELVIWECELKNPKRVERRVRKFLDA